MNKEIFQLYLLYLSFNYWGEEVFSESISKVWNCFRIPQGTAGYYPSSGMHPCGGVPTQESGNLPSIPCFIHRIWPITYNPTNPKNSPWPLTTVINSPQTLSWILSSTIVVQTSQAQATYPTEKTSGYSKSELWPKRMPRIATDKSKQIL